MASRKAHNLDYAGSTPASAIINENGNCPAAEVQQGSCRIIGYVYSKCMFL